MANHWGYGRGDRVARGKLGKRARSGILAFALLLAMSAGMIGADGRTASAAVNFSDIRGHWAEQTILWAAENGIVSGYPDGTFKPENPVSEAEFLVMLFRAFPQAEIPPLSPGDPWHKPYYTLAEQYNWPIFFKDGRLTFNRGRVAQVLAASQGRLLHIEEAIAFLMENGLASGKTGPTVTGYAANDPLKRAEALTLIRNLSTKGLTLKRAAGSADAIVGHPFRVGGVSIGDSEAGVIAKLGQPARKDASEYGFDWYIYNQDYSRYVQIGIRDGRVVGLYTNSADWQSGTGIGLGSPRSEVEAQYGEPLPHIEKNNARYAVPNGETAPKYLVDGAYVTLFLDVHEGGAVTAVQLIDQQTEHGLDGYYGTPGDALRVSFEYQLFDLANAVRARMGKKPFIWDGSAAETARAHSADMAQNGFFSHVNPRGESVGDRLKAGGINYREAAENIAAGHPNAIYAHEDWMNSDSGHRETILGDTTHLGVGVHFGGDYYVYYTQNFFTPAR